MPESSKCSLTELIARLSSNGVPGIRQKFPDQNHFLIVPIKQKYTPLVWTPHETARLPMITKSIKIEPEKLNIDTNSTVVPIKKNNKNESLEILIGRNYKCDIQFSSEYVSDIHVTISIHNIELWIRDSGSTNGTLINDIMLEPGRAQKLSPGDEISLAGIYALYTDLELLVNLAKMSQ